LNVHARRACYLAVVQILEEREPVCFELLLFLVYLFANTFAPVRHERTDKSVPAKPHFKKVAVAVHETLEKALRLVLVLDKEAAVAPPCLERTSRFVR
jgi:hypothetical protein